MLRKEKLRSLKFRWCLMKICESLDIKNSGKMRCVMLVKREISTHTNTYTQKYTQTYNYTHTHTHTQTLEGWRETVDVR